MSLVVSRSDGVTVLALFSDPSSACPPLCQLLGALCNNAPHCSACRRLSPQRVVTQAALGALWIITGILHIGLGVILLTTWGPDMSVMRHTGYSPLWLGVLFMFCGVGCVLTERYPRPNVFLLSGLLSGMGAALSVIAIIIYSTEYSYPFYWYNCEKSYYDYSFYGPTIASPERDVLKERCQEALVVVMKLTSGIFTALITLSVLDLCLGISSVTLGFKALKQLNSSRPLQKEE